MLESLRGRIRGQLLFRVLYFFADIFQDDKVIIDDGIQQGVGEIIRPGLPDGLCSS